MKKNITFCINGVDVDVIIRRIKRGELEELFAVIAGKLDCLAGLSGDPKISLSSMGAFVVKNTAFICDQVILPLTNLSLEQSKKMDVYDIVRLSEEILKHNGIEWRSVVNFLKAFLSERRKPSGIINFSGVTVPPVPSQS